MSPSGSKPSMHVLRSPLLDRVRDAVVVCAIRAVGQRRFRAEKISAGHRRVMSDREMALAEPNAVRGRFVHLFPSSS